MHMSTNSILRKIATLSSVVVLGLFSVVGVVNTSAQTDSGSIQINILPGTLSVSVNDCVMTVNGDGTTAPTVSASEQTVRCTVLAQFNDLRGNSAVGWSVTATMTNFQGATDNTILGLCRNRINSATGENIGVDCSEVSDFSLTPGAMQRVAGQPVNQGLNDVTTAQNAAGLSSPLTATQTNNPPFNIGGYNAGGGEGSYQKNLTLQQVIPPYTRAQTYNATLTLTIA